jgi:hypothetical protein
MQQAAGESPQKPHLSEPLPCNLVDKAYVLVPCQGGFASRLEHQNVTITYLLVWRGNNQPVSFFAPPERYYPCGVRPDCTLSKCADLPWIVNRFYIGGLNRDYRANWVIRRALDNINSWTQYLDDHPKLDNHPNDALATHPARGPSP